MFVLVPYNIDVPIYRRPYVNFGFLGLIFLVFMGMFAGILGRGFAEPLILDGFAPLGLIGHLWLHVSFGHVIGNMIFLWTFGNAINAKVGNLAYAGIYLLLGLFAAVTHNLLDGRTAVGASGAINGIVGMCLVLYPVSDLKLVWWVFIRTGTFRIRAFWMIGLWFVFDVWGAFSQKGVVAYWAHLGGFLAGAGLALGLLKLGWIRMVEYELSILDVIGKKATPEALAEAEPRAQYQPPPLAQAQMQAQAATTTPAALATAPRPHRAPVPRPPAPTPPPPALPGAPPPEMPGAAPALPRETPPAVAPIAVTCPQCGKPMQAPPSFSGRQVKCPACAQVIPIP